MTELKSSIDVLIIGAGLTGLIAANVLRQHGVQSLLVEQENRVGGRLATLTLGNGRGDYGAQFFTVRSQKFQAWVEDWLVEGLAYRWSTGWSNGSLAPVNVDGFPRYAIRHGMQALAQHLAQGLRLRLNTKVVLIKNNGVQWQAHTVSGQVLTARALLLTAPLPQLMALLNDSHIKLADPDQRLLLPQIEYAPCVTGLFRLTGAIHLPEPGAIQHAYAPVNWIADNTRKGISPDEVVVTVQAGGDYSRQLWPLMDRDVLEALQSGFLPYLGTNAVIAEGWLKRWRYSAPLAQYPQSAALAVDVPPLVLAGDTFGAPRIEGAALSGIAAGQLIQAQL
jgi:renalase